MVDTTDIKEVVVTPETPLNPSPKRVEGHEIGETVSADLGSVAGTLHKPPLKIETEDKGQSTAEELVKSAEERPQVFKNVVLDTLKAKGLIQIKDKNALVDRFGNPVIKSNVGETVTIDEIDTELATAGKVIGSDGHGNAVWLDKANVIETDDIRNVLDDVHSGDIVSILDTGELYIIINSFSEYVNAFYIADDNYIYSYGFAKREGEWVLAGSISWVEESNLRERATKLYKHHVVVNYVGDINLELYLVLSTNTTLTLSNFNEVLLSNSFISGYLIDEDYFISCVIIRIFVSSLKLTGNCVAYNHDTDNWFGAIETLTNNYTSNATINSISDTVTPL